MMVSAGVTAVRPTLTKENLKQPRFSGETDGSAISAVAAGGATSAPTFTALSPISMVAGFLIELVSAPFKACFPPREVHVYVVSPTTGELVKVDGDANSIPTHPSITPIRPYISLIPSHPYPSPQ